MKKSHLLASVLCVGALVSNPSAFPYFPIAVASAATTEIDLGTFSYTGKDITPMPTVNDPVTLAPLVENRDYTVRYMNNRNAGIGSVHVTGIGNYQGKIDIEGSFRIEKEKITVKVDDATQEDGIHPAFSYTIVFGEIKENDFLPVPTYTVSATGDANIQEIKATFAESQNYSITTIPGKLYLSGKSFVAQTLSDVVYDGTAKTPKPLVKAKDGTVLKEGTDYTLRYSNNRNAGTATVAVVGMGKYGEVPMYGGVTAAYQQTLSFRILPADITVKVNDVVSTTNAAPSYGYTIVKGQVYSGDTLGTPTYTLYKITETTQGIKATFPSNANYTITVQDGTMSNASVTAPSESVAATVNTSKGIVCISAISPVSYNGNEQIPLPSLYLKNGGRLSFGTDFTVTYRNNKNAGTASVDISGLGDYKGLSASIPFEIKKASVAVRVNDVRCSIHDKPTYTYQITGGQLYNGYSLGTPRYVLNSLTGATYGPTFSIDAIFSTHLNYDIVVTKGKLTYYDVETDTPSEETDGLKIESIGAVTYNGDYQEPVVTVLGDNNKELTEGVHYSLTYMNNLHAGVATVKATGMGMYRGLSGVKNFVIKKKPITVYVEDVTVVQNEEYSGSYYTSVDLYDGDTLGKESWTLPSSSKPLGAYTISVSFPNSKDYDVSVRNGTLHIVRDGSWNADRYTVKATASTGGTISPSGTVTVSRNSSKTFRFIPDNGYRVSGVYVNGAKVSSTATSYTLSNILEDNTIRVEFSKGSSDTYAIYARASEGGTISTAGTTSVKAGGRKTYTFTPNTGYEIIGVYVDGEFVHTDSSYEFVNVLDDHDIFVEYAKKNLENGRYRFTIETTDGGRITPNNEGKLVVAKNSDREFSFVPNEGYRINAVYIDGRSIGTPDSYEFKSISSDHSIRVEFVKNSFVSNQAARDWKNPFWDIQNTDWFYDSVAYMNGNSLMNGVSETLFEPYSLTTRGMIVSILHRIEGKPTVSVYDSFRDVYSSDYFYEAIRWATANNIVNGYEDGTFRPSHYITREELATILYRYAAYKGIAGEYSGVHLGYYSDYRDIKPYALVAMGWANGAELIKGRSGSILAPQDLATRAEVATILSRFCRGFLS